MYGLVGLVGIEGWYLLRTSVISPNLLVVVFQLLWRVGWSRGLGRLVGVVASFVCQLLVVASILHLVCCLYRSLTNNVGAILLWSQLGDVCGLEGKYRENVVGWWGVSGGLLSSAFFLHVLHWSEICMLVVLSVGCRWGNSVLTCWLWCGLWLIC